MTQEQKRARKPGSRTVRNSKRFRPPRDKMIRGDERDSFNKGKP